MKRKIKNVFATADYNCFACSPHNKQGLQLQFYELDDYVQSEWIPLPQFEGYPGVIHGGIQATLLDEIGAWTMYIKARCSGVTSRMNLKYIKPLDSKQGKILLRGKLKEIVRNICYIDAEILNEKEEVYLWGTGNALREFLYVDDLADALLHLMNHYSDEIHVNIGTGQDLSIHELALIVKETIGFDGVIVYDTSKPDGTPRKLLNVDRLHQSGWEHTTSLHDGIYQVYQWYLKEKA
jgi:acyl-coenzyme A thioesterase PaaI-like protein